MSREVKLRAGARRFRKAFQERFVKDVRHGVKRQTIRGVPKRESDRPQAGDVLVAFRWEGVAYRSEQRVIGEFVIQEVLWVAMDCENDVVHAQKAGLWGKTTLQGEELEELARKDGFGSWEEMKGWFVEKHGDGVFRGMMLRW